MISSVKLKSLCCWKVTRQMSTSFDHKNLLPAKIIIDAIYISLRFYRGIAKIGEENTLTKIKFWYMFRTEFLSLKGYVFFYWNTNFGFGFLLFLTRGYISYGCSTVYTVKNPEKWHMCNKIVQTPLLDMS